MIKDIKEGDKLLTINTKTHDIYSTSFLDYLHISPTTEKTFYKFSLDNSEFIEVTGNHLQYTQEDKYIKAKDVNIGDTQEKISINMDDNLIKGESVYAQITKIEMVTKVGVYAPLTNSGTFVVNGYQVSSFFDASSFKYAYYGFLPYRVQNRLPGLRYFVRRKGEDGVQIYWRYLEMLRGWVEFVMGSVGSVYGRFMAANNKIHIPRAFVEDR